MNPFPAVDPIPLPAPVWLFKFLHLLTFTLHAASVELMLGGVLLAVFWALAGRGLGNRSMTSASGAMTGQLPVIMAYVVNLGIPPLLFTQVLYGRTLYTSSVLIGAFWISVIVLVIAAYRFFYVIADRAAEGRRWEPRALLALAICLFIAWIYSNNMTLMLRPAEWREIYRTNPHGTQLAPSGDPTLLPRWLFMVLGAPAFAGVSAMFLGRSKRLGADTAGFLRRNGAAMVIVFALAQAAMGLWAFKAQPEAVRQAVWASGLSRVSAYVWFASAALLLAGGALAWMTASGGSILGPIVCSLAGFLDLAGMVIVRDAIRDSTLRLRDFDVWNRTIVTNWSVVVLFFILFVIGLGLLGWMISVVAHARQGGQESNV